jgi:UDP-N-acetylglucosamine--N-acetylmuramyl-(pentapeptide) pyrophosphoryl-undecaprenol N-acetylglucosamine transferase
MSHAPPFTVVLAGGGSGGHLYPALAIAERLVEIAPQTRTIFVCSERAIDRRILSGAGVDFFPIPARPWSWRPRLLKAWFFAHVRSRRILEQLMRRESVAAVVALGGFAAAPAVSAARTLGIPVTLVNLDARPGKANRWMARRCHRVLTATAVSGAAGFGGTVTGMPVRRAAIRRASPEECRRALGLHPARPTLLVMGGSQGAQSINGLMEALLAADPCELDGWQVLHLCGAGAEPALREAYRRSGVSAVVEPFLEEMGGAWGAADLAISRAGASSVAEAALNAVPTVFLPYPFHRDQHQRLNAEPMVAAGAAVMAEDVVDPAPNLARLRPLLAELLGSPERRAAMRAAAGRAGRPDGALRIARIVAGAQARSGISQPATPAGPRTMAH